MIFIELAEWWDLEALKIEILLFEVWKFSTKYSNFSSKLLGINQFLFKKRSKWLTPIRQDKVYKIQKNGAGENEKSLDTFDFPNLKSV